MSVKNQEETEGGTKRDFLILSAGAFAAIGAAGFVWPLISSLNPGADVLALASTEVDLSSIKPGQTVKVMWRGKPVFIRHRTEAEIKTANEVDISKLPDPEADSARVKKGHEQWLIMVGVCTHLGCIPLSDQGDYKAWYCPCHGSHYDISGRIRKGPAPTNLIIPPYEFLNDTRIRIG